MPKGWNPLTEHSFGFHDLCEEAQEALRKIEDEFADKFDELRDKKIRSGSRRDYDRFVGTSGRSEAFSRVLYLQDIVAASFRQTWRMFKTRLSDFDLDAIAPIIFQAARDMAIIYAASVGVGAGLGALAGGIGAVPGAGLGFALGTAINAALGLYGVLEYVVKDFPLAARYYNAGFSAALSLPDEEAENDFNYSVGTFDIAQGNFILIVLLLIGILSIASKGKGAEEIAKCAKLGAPVRDWALKHASQANIGKLEKIIHPSYGFDPAGGSAKALPLPKRAGDYRGESVGQVKKAATEEIPKMEKVKVPCFKADGLKGKEAELDRQLHGQENGLNKLTVQEYLDGRATYKDARTPAVAKQARADFKKELANNAKEILRKQGYSAKAAEAEAANIAANKMKTLAALHNPDLVAGGKDVISDFGDRIVNSSIGGQWNKRIATLDKAAEAVPANLRSSVTMNSSLVRCK
jgi:hypothetical protein